MCIMMPELTDREDRRSLTNEDVLRRKASDMPKLIIRPVCNVTNILCLFFTKEVCQT